MGKSSPARMRYNRRKTLEQREIHRGRMHWKKCAEILHSIEHRIGGDYYEVVDAFRDVYAASGARDWDANEFNRLCAGGKVDG